MRACPRPRPSPSPRCRRPLAIGVNERNAEASGSTLYNSLLFLDAEGRVLGCHRKLVPTGGERLVYGQGDGSTLAVHQLACGRVGGLVCWENYMPLARETILYVEVDPRRVAGPRWQLDVAGHYARPDVFQLTALREPRPLVRFAAPREPDQG